MALTVRPCARFRRSSRRGTRARGPSRDGVDAARIDSTGASASPIPIHMSLRHQEQQRNETTRLAIKLHAVIDVFAVDEAKDQTGPALVAIDPI